MSDMIAYITAEHYYDVQDLLNALSEQYPAIEFRGNQAQNVVVNSPDDYYQIEYGVYGTPKTNLSEPGVALMKLEMRAFVLGFVAHFNSTFEGEALKYKTMRVKFS